MKILILSGSARRQGTTARMVDVFEQGAFEASHTISRFDTAHLKIHACTGCDMCLKADRRGQCVFEDDMLPIYAALKEADAVIFVTPLYYFSMAGPLKITIDRFYAIDDQLRSRPRKAYLLAACADEDEKVLDGLVKQFELICDYLHWPISGSVLASAAGEPDDLTQHILDLCRKLGENLN